MSHLMYLYLYCVTRAGRGPGQMGVGSGAAPLAQSEAPQCPLENRHRGAMAGPCVGPPGLIPAPQCSRGGEEPESYILRFEGHLSARAGDEALCEAGARGCRSGGPHRLQGPWLGWGTSAVAAVQDSNANQCSSSLLEEQRARLCFGLSSPRFKVSLKALWITCKSGLSFARFSRGDIMAPFESALPLWGPASPCPSSSSRSPISAELSWGWGQACAPALAACCARGEEG